MLRNFIVVSTIMLCAMLLGIAPAQSQAPGECENWTQVNDGAFGLPSNFDSSGNVINPPPVDPYSSEEGFEVLVFNNQLYLGMEADNKFGARLWRTRSGVTIPLSQADWEEVAADSSGKPFGVEDISQNDHIDSLAEFNGYLYASTANGGTSALGTRIFRTATGAPFQTNPGDWSDALAGYGPGFGDVNNVNFKDMQIFQGQLCGGTQNWTTGAQVWCTADGTTWNRQNRGGFGASMNDSSNGTIWSGFVFKGNLYFGLQNLGVDGINNNSDDIGKLFRTSSLSGTNTSWSQVYTGPDRSFRVDLLGETGGYLYISAQSDQGIDILRSDTGDPGTWTQVNLDGMNGDANNSGTVVDGATLYNNYLYVGVSNPSSGATVWRTAGVLQNPGSLVDWSQIGESGLGDPNNIYAELIPFNGYLYAWTSNYVSGGQVRRSKCPICQSLNINGPGAYSFDQVGATLNFTSENLDSATVCVYPDAFPTMQTGMDKPVKRHYELYAFPSSAPFSADVTLSYTSAEFTASGSTDEWSTYLSRWDASQMAWQACPLDQRSRDVAAHTATCSSVTDFSTWAISADGHIPNAVKTTSFQASNGWHLPNWLTIPGLGLVLWAVIFMSLFFYHFSKKKS